MHTNPCGWVKSRSQRVDLFRSQTNSQQLERGGGSPLALAWETMVPVKRGNHAEASRCVRVRLPQRHCIFHLHSPWRLSFSQLYICIKYCSAFVGLVLITLDGNQDYNLMSS